MVRMSHLIVMMVFSLSAALFPYLKLVAELPAFYCASKPVWALSSPWFLLCRKREILKMGDCPHFCGAGLGKMRKVELEEAVGAGCLPAFGNAVVDPVRL